MLLNMLSYQPWGLGLLTICHGQAKTCVSAVFYIVLGLSKLLVQLLLQREASVIFPSGEPACSVQAHLLQKLAYQSAQTRLQEPMQLQ